MSRNTEELLEGRGLLAPVTAAPLEEEIDVSDPRRQEIRAWLLEHPNPSGRQLADAGLVAPGWPAPWGRGADVETQLIIDDELSRANVQRPINPIGIGWAGPTIVHAGTAEQQERWLPRLLSGDDFWCQLFSEPDAGSDLASLTTSARRDGDEWVISGQKVWTSYAHIAAWGILLARTSNEGPHQRGVSYFVCPMNAPGVTIRPLVDMTGDHAFNEVFLDDVRLPADHLIGTVNDGWRLAKVTLGNERVSLSGEGALWGRGPTASDLVDLVREHHVAHSALERDELVKCWSHGEILRYLRLRLLAAALAGREPGAEASVRKALADDHGQEVMTLAHRLAGAAGMLEGRGPGAMDGTEGASWSYGFLYARALTIGGGTSEVQRNIIAERVLGLPKDAPGV
ncbi:MAG TPA: acyl-CoA dehydrogenase family protein [Acidimicrobiales bacterium]|nr:acyl-CoA dehydrogenase family protein [Acidimicrobiales bacterium]